MVIRWSDIFKSGQHSNLLYEQLQNYRQDQQTQSSTRRDPCREAGDSNDCINPCQESPSTRSQLLLHPIAFTFAAQNRPSKRRVLWLLLERTDVRGNSCGQRTLQIAHTRRLSHPLHRHRQQNHLRVFRLRRPSQQFLLLRKLRTQLRVRTLLRTFAT